MRRNVEVIYVALSVNDCDSKMLTSTNEKVIAQYNSEIERIKNYPGSDWTRGYSASHYNDDFILCNGMEIRVYRPRNHYYSYLEFTLDVAGITINDLNNLGLNRPDLIELFKYYLNSIKFDVSAEGYLDNIKFGDFNEELNEIVQKWKNNIVNYTI